MFIRAHPWFLKILATLTFTCTLGVAEPLSAAEPETLGVNEYRQSIERLDPMDTTGLDYNVANVLRNYYKNTFTRFPKWEALESIQFEGALHLPQGVVRFSAFKKKPDYIKIVILVGNGGRIVMGYDGVDAWQLNTLQLGAVPTAMPEAEALNFIRDATTGGHMLYPLVKGKTITLEGVGDVDGQRAYHLRIQLPDGQQIQSFLDMTTFAEIRQITINNVNGDEEVTTHSDFRRIDGIRIPFTSTLTIEGEQIHQSRISKAQTNKGVTPWMFARPSSPSLEPSRKGAQIGNASFESSPVASVLGTEELDSLLRTGGHPDAPQNQLLSPLATPSDPWSTKSVFDIDPDLLTPLVAPSSGGVVE